jgi:thioredoxin reductase (NADPH)
LEYIMITVEELASIKLFSTLEPKVLDYLANNVEDIRLIEGEYVVREGDDRALFVIVEGFTELTKIINGIEQIVATREPGELFGEVPMTFSTPFPASCRATERVRILKLSVKAYYTLAAMAPQIAEHVSTRAAKLIPELKTLVSQPLEATMVVIGPRLDANVRAMETFLHRNQITFDSLTPDDPAVAACTGEQGIISGPYPVVHLKDGTRLVAPTLRVIAKVSGLPVTPSRTSYDVVIVGGGPAGMAAAVNAASEGLRTVLIEPSAPGGQAGTSSRIENYLGFPFGVSGDDLASRALQQAKRLGAEILVTRSVERIDPVNHTVTLDGGETLRTKAVIIASGVSWRRIALESIDRFMGAGVYYAAARSDAALTQGKDIYLIGAGNSAGQAAIFFSGHARAVTLIVRAESLTQSMSQYLIDQIASKPNIRVETQSEVVGVHGGEHLEAIEVIHRRTGEISRRDATVLFVMIGADAITKWLPPEIARDSHGYILTGGDAEKQDVWESEREPYALETSVPGIFAIGDVRSGSVKRVAAAVGEGGMAISYVHRYLQSISQPKPAPR